MVDSESGFQVHYVLRPIADSLSYSEEDDIVWITSVGDPFMYVIPSFDVLAVELRRMKIRAYSRRDGKEKTWTCSLGMMHLSAECIL